MITNARSKELDEGHIYKAQFVHKDRPGLVLECNSYFNGIFASNLDIKL